MAPPVSAPAMDANVHGLVNSAAPPTSVGLAEYSAGNLVQANVSCTHITRRKAMFEKKWRITCWLVRTPAGAGAPLAQSAAAKVPVAASSVGHAPEAAVNSSIWLRSS